MKISSKFKKIISVMMCCVVVLIPCLSTFAKGEAGDWGDDTYHEAYEDFSDSPKYSTSDLVYTGEVSQNLTIDFNMIQQFGMDWTTDSRFYMSRPFSFRKRWNYENSLYLNFGAAGSDQNKMFMKEKFNSIASSTFVTSNNINMSDYDVYYTVRSSYAVSNEYGYLTLDYWFIPKGRRIAISNQNHPEDDVDYTKVWYGIWFASESDLDETYKLCWHYSFEIRGETGGVTTGDKGFIANPFYSFLGRSHLNLIATNIPVFTQKDSAKQYVVSGSSTEDPSNKVTDDENVNNRLSASSFGWDSFKCRLSQTGKAYNFIYNYTYSSSDMKKDPSSYFMDIEYSQVIRYRNRVNTSAYEDKTATKKSCMLVSSTGTSTDSLSVIDTKGNFGQQFIYTICLLVDEASSFFGSGTDLTNIDIYSSNIYVTVKLRHKRILSDNPILDGADKILSDISSDVRTFKFNALDLSSLDSPEEITSDVVTKDAVDSDGNVIKDSNGNPVKEVSQIITNDNSTHTTINNYYYNSDGKQSTSPDGSSIGDSLSDIASGLIKFIKTLVTEGLPAALEVLKTLIKSVSDLVGFAFDQIGDIGAGTSQGLIAVLKAIPTPLWGICSVGLIVFVIAGVLKKIF